MKRSIWALMPLYLWTLMLVVLPIGYVIAISFMTPNITHGVDTVFSTESYRALIAPVNLKIIWASLQLGFWTTLLTLLIGYPFAYAMTKQPKKRRNLILLLVIVPFWTSALLRVYGWMILLRSNGAINGILMDLHLIGSPVKFLYNNGAVLFGMVYSLLPFMILPLYAALDKLDAHIIEASRDLGANGIKSFATITLPLTVPGIVSGCLLVFVPSVGLFFISDLMGGGQSMLLGNLISHYLQMGKNWPLGAALSMVMMVLTFLTMALYRKYSGESGLGVIS